MIHVIVNKRHLSIRFCYTKKYTIEVPVAKDVMAKAVCTTCGCGRAASAHREIKDKFEGQTVRVPAHHKYKPNIASMTDVERSLTQCYIEEGEGAAKKILAKCEKKVYFKDKVFDKKSPQAEALRKLLIKYALEAAGAQLSKDERRVLWHSFLSRHTSKPNVIVGTPPTNLPTPPPAQGMASVRVRTPGPARTPDDTTTPGMEIIRLPQKSPEGHAVKNVMVFPAGRWNYGSSWPDLLGPKEIVH